MMEMMMIIIISKLVCLLLVAEVSYGRGADLQISASDPPAQVAATANVVVDDGDEEEEEGEGGVACSNYPDPFQLLEYQMERVGGQI